MKCFPGAVAAREHARGSVANVAHAERVDETFERDLAARLDGTKQVAHRDLAEAFDLLQFDLGVARLERKNFSGLLHPVLLEEQLNLLFTQPLDVHRSAGYEVPQVLNFLI